MQLAPLAHAQEGEEVRAAPVAQFRLGQVLVGDGVGGPELEHAEEIGFRIGELGVRGVGLLTGVGGAFARILDAQERDQDHHLAGHAETFGLDQHARQGDVDRQVRDGAADRGDAVVLVDRSDLDQAPVAIADRALVRRFDERKVGDFAELQAQHAQDHPGQRGAQDLGVGIAWAFGKIVLGIEPIADAGGDAAAAALALVGGGLRDRLDVQAFELAALAVALDPRGAGIDHEADARHGQRGFGDVGGQHDASLGSGPEHAVLLVRRQSRVQGQHFGLAVLAPVQGQVRIADLALAGQEHEHVAAWVLGTDFVDRGDDLLDRVRLTALGWRTPAHFNGPGAAFDLDHRRVVEMRGEARRVDRRRGHDQLEVTASGQQALEIAEQEIDVEAALVGLVEDDRVVGAEPGVALGFGEQDAVGHELDQGGLADLFGEAHLEADQVADRRVELAGDTTGHRARGDAARLGAADHALHAAAGGEAELGQLGGLAGTGLAGQHDDLVFADQPDDLFAAFGDRQRRVDPDRRQPLRTRGDSRHRVLDIGAQTRQLVHGRVRSGLFEAPEASDQATAIARRDRIQRGLQFGEFGHRIRIWGRPAGWAGAVETVGAAMIAAGYRANLPKRFPSLRRQAQNGLSILREKTPMAIDIGISAKDRKKIADHLSRLLADNYSLYLKTHSFHWNVTGPMFNSLHVMFETQYNELWLANDVIAERIRALDVMAPGSYSQFGKLTSIREEPGVPEWKDMVAQLVEGHETAARTARETIKVAGKADDQPTADLATQRVEAHEKTAWMLRSLLK